MRAGRRVTAEGKRLILDSILRPEWMPDGDWRTIDFGGPGQEDVEVTDYLAPVLRQVTYGRRGSQGYL